jgi:septum formation protein
MKRIILASGSPRRKQLLELAEVPFEVVVSEADENYPEELSPDEIALYIASNKAWAVRRKLSVEGKGEGHTILAADTVVVLENEVIGKPQNRQHAIEILSHLSGKTHKVITGVCILNGDEKKMFAEETLVAFHDLSLAQIEYYIDKYKPYDKAGAYAIQEWIGAVGIKSIKGDFYNVMGLPVSKVMKEMVEMIIASQKSK